MTSTLEWRSGLATHYGPFPVLPHLSEIGYQPNDVGVGCSNGVPGGDPRWNKILQMHGTYNASEIRMMAGSSMDGKKLEAIKALETVVWPKAFTVAVSEKAYGFANKKAICYQALQIRNAKNHSLAITAYVVDFCPAAGCNWRSDQVSQNVDLYGQAAWTAVGAGLTDGSVDIQVIWPAGIVPNTAFTRSQCSILLLSCLVIFLL